MISSLVYLIEQLGVALAFAGSVFYIAFFFSSIRDGVIDDKERHIMRLSYMILRIGMGFIVLTTAIAIVWNVAVGNGAYFNDLFWFLTLLLVVILSNIALTALHREPNWLSSFIQASSWYAYFLAYTLRPSKPFVTLLLLYLLWVLVALYVFTVLRNRFINKGSSSAA